LMTIRTTTMMISTDNIVRKEKGYLTRRTPDQAPYI
jgi:hypothetical protein